MKLLYRSAPRRRQALAGVTLVETLMSLTIAILTIGGTVNGYIFSTARAERSAYSLAAHSIALQRLEQVRAAKWDPTAYPPIDQVMETNFPVAIDILDLPIAGTNAVSATTFTTIRAVSANPPLKLVRVDCVWTFLNRGTFTNTMVSYRAPDQ